MGKCGQPVVIDFTKQYAIALITQITNNDAKLAFESLNKNDKNIELTCSQTIREKQSFTSRNIKLLMIDYKYEGVLIIQKKYKSATNKVRCTFPLKLKFIPL